MLLVKVLAAVTSGAVIFFFELMFCCGSFCWMPSLRSMSMLDAVVAVYVDGCYRCCVLAHPVWDTSITSRRRRDRRRRRV